jgi:hypothetical protein
MNEMDDGSLCSNAFGGEVTELEAIRLALREVGESAVPPNVTTLAAVQWLIGEHHALAAQNEELGAEVSVLADELALREQSAALTSRGVDAIAAERARQVNAEGWTTAHDQAHGRDELAVAAACYATPYDLRDPHGRTGQVPRMWPWRLCDWKPGDRIRELVKAGALLAAELDRLLVDEQATPSPEASSEASQEGSS